MSEHGKAGEARRGLIDSMKGKAKEVVGAITGNDSLTAEGQLDQTQAHERKEANAAEAVAESKAKHAREAVAEAKADGAQQRLAANAQTVAAENSINAQSAAQKQAADVAAQRQAATQRAQAELEAQREAAQAKVEERQELRDATEDVVDAVAEHQSDVQVAKSEESEADRLRRQSEHVTNDADLP
ncbi:CsbD family protein [Mycobacterium sp. 050134]|uniref:CsbD family protein n=1 Tax=Mycobacterium sp. 050134 TaxID=3096111 RepID=UPI002ED8C917